MLEEKLLMMLEGLKIPEREKAEVLNELYDLGIQDLVLDMFGWFSIGFIMDFVKLSRLFGEYNERETEIESARRLGAV